LLLALANSILFISLRIGDVLSVDWFVDILNITYVLYGLGLIIFSVGLVISFILNFKMIIKTKKKYIVLVLLLIIALFIIHNESKCDPWTPTYPEGQEECTNLTQGGCFNNTFCRATFGPSYCCGGACTADMAYHGCVKIPDEELAEAEINKKLCEKTHGSWNRQIHNEPGGCGCSIDPLENSSNFLYGIGRIYFDKEKGCISQKRECEEDGGAWTDPEPFQIKEREDISKEKCVTSSPFALLNWSIEKNICLITRFRDPYPKCDYN